MNYKIIKSIIYQINNNNNDFCLRNNKNNKNNKRKPISLVLVTILISCMILTSPYIVNIKAEPVTTSNKIISES